MWYAPEFNKVFSTHSEIRRFYVGGDDVPFICFPQNMPKDLEFCGIFPLRSETPEVEPGQVAVPVVVDLVDDFWTQLWTVRDMTPEEVADVVAAVELLRDEKRAEIDQSRAAANASTFPHGGKQIACDALSRSDIDGVANHIALFGGFPEGWPGGWKATDKSMLPLTDVDAFRAMYASMTAEGTSNFNHSQNLKAQLALAKTPKEIAAIQW